MKNSFFLTRQTANLMEDFSRELAKSSAFYLLYGVAGVGKTRLLLELMKRRLDDPEVYYVDLTAARFEGVEKLQQLVAQAQPDAILILDHFDRAANKVRHAVYQEWSVNGVDKQLNFIVACRDVDFNEFRQLSQQYRVAVQSFQLLPFNQDEIEAFLAFYLFGQSPLTSLTMPGPLRRQVKQSNGVVRALIELADREKAEIVQVERPDSITEQRKAAYLLAALIVCGASGLGLWFLGNWSGHQSVEQVSAAPQVDSPQVLPREAAEATGAEPTTQSIPARPVIEHSPLPNPDPVVKEKAAQAPDAEDRVEDDLDPAVQVTSDTLPETGLLASSTQTLVTEVEPDNPSIDTEVPEVAPSLFERLLESSRQWLESNDPLQGTIQIMSLGSGNFSEANFFNYLERLKAQDIDISRVRVFYSQIRSNTVYTVTYGLYDSRQVALSAIGSLPSTLRANGPIPRTLAGIAGELAN